MGCWMTFGFNLITSSPYNYRETVGEWWRSLFYLDPNVAAAQDAPLIYQLHAIIAWGFWAAFPFSRLVHAWSIPLQYLGRPYILYRRRYGAAPPLHPDERARSGEPTRRGQPGAAPPKSRRHLARALPLLRMELPTHRPISGPLGPDLQTHLGPRSLSDVPPLVTRLSRRPAASHPAHSRHQTVRRSLVFACVTSDAWTLAPLSRALALIHASGASGFAPRSLSLVRLRRRLVRRPYGRTVCFVRGSRTPSDQGFALGIYGSGWAEPSCRARRPRRPHGARGARRPFGIAAPRARRPLAQVPLGPNPRARPGPSLAARRSAPAVRASTPWLAPLFVHVLRSRRFVAVLYAEALGGTTEEPTRGAGPGFLRPSRSSRGRGGRFLAQRAGAEPRSFPRPHPPVALRPAFTPSCRSAHRRPPDGVWRSPGADRRRRRSFRGPAALACAAATLPRPPPYPRHRRVPGGFNPVAAVWLPSGGRRRNGRGGPAGGSAASSRHGHGHRQVRHRRLCARLRAARRRRARLPRGPHRPYPHEVRRASVSPSQTIANEEHEHPRPPERAWWAGGCARRRRRRPARPARA